MNGLWKKLTRTKPKTNFKRNRYGGATRVIRYNGANNTAFEENENTTRKSVYEPTEAIYDVCEDVFCKNLEYNDYEVDETNDMESDVSENIPDDHFICPINFTKQSQNSGPNIRKRFLISNACYGAHDIQKIIDEFNSSTQRHTTDDIKKHILVERIPNIQNIKELAMFLVCSDSDICCKVISAIQRQIFNNDDFSDQTENLLDAEQLVWSFLERHVANDDMVSKAANLDLMLWSSVLSNNIPLNPDSEQMRHIFDITSKRSTRSKIFLREIRGKVSRDVLLSIVSYMDRFRHHLTNKSVLPLTHNENSAVNTHATQEIRKGVAKATFCERYTFILRQLRLVSKKIDCRCYGYLLDAETCLPKGIDQSGKHAIRILLLNGLVNALTDSYQEEINEAGQQGNHPILIVCCIMKKIFDDKYFKSKHQRVDIYLGIMLPLLHHNSQKVRDTCLYILGRFRKILSIPDAFKRSIQNIMSNCCLQVYYKHGEEAGPCPMYQFAGTFGGRAVTIKVLVQKLQCISEGDIDKCIENKPQETFHLEINHVDVLRSLKSHSNIVQLIAYQIKPSPFFNIQEDVHNCCLQKYLLERRASKRWLPEKKRLQFLLDIITGLKYIHLNGLIVRNLTQFSVIHSEEKIKLADMSYACTPQEDMNPGNIPTLWLAPEAIWKGEFSMMSDLYALGLTAYGIWTHGCEPYTELYGKTTEEVLKYVLFHSTPPFQWPCIPNEVHSLILRCTKTDPKERIELDVLKKEVQELIKSSVQTVRITSIQDILDEDKMYPELIVGQKKNEMHVPQKGIPVEFVNMRRKGLYTNQQSSMWQSTVPIIRSDEFQTSDSLVIYEQFDSLLVEEPVSKDFLTKILPHIKAEHFRNTGGDMIPDPMLSRDGSNTYILESKFPAGRTLENAAKTRWLGVVDPYENVGVESLNNEDIVNQYLKICLNVAEIVNQYHKHGWLHRDISAETIILAKTSDASPLEVFMPRLGRMCRCPVQTSSSVNVIKGQLFHNRFRWLPPESIIDGIYSPQSDVYMWAVMCWEVFILLELHVKRALLNEMLSKPFCFIKKEELLVSKQSGEQLEKPDLCPSWFYDLLQHCWMLNRTDRPSMNYIITRMTEIIPPSIITPKTVEINDRRRESCSFMRPNPGRRNKRPVLVDKISTALLVNNHLSTNAFRNGTTNNVLAQSPSRGIYLPSTCKGHAETELHVYSQIFNPAQHFYMNISDESRRSETVGKECLKGYTRDQQMVLNPTPGHRNEEEYIELTSSVSAQNSSQLRIPQNDTGREAMLNDENKHNYVRQSFPNSFLSSDITMSSNESESVYAELVEFEDCDYISLIE